MLIRVIKASKWISLFYLILIYSVSINAQSVISVNHNQLNFGATGTGGGAGAGPFISPPQTVLITGSGPLDGSGGGSGWSASISDSWITASPSSGKGAGNLSVSVNTTGLMDGDYSGTITISDPDATNSPQSIVVKSTIYSDGSSSAPFGSFDLPESGTTVEGSIAVSGWALDDVDVAAVKIYNDTDSGFDYIGDAVFVDGARSDVEANYPDYPKNYQAGWGYMLLTNVLPDGMTILTALATDIEGNTTELGTQMIHVDNANAVKPFGAIDTPEQGGVASGSEYPVWGWVLTPQPNTIPTDGSTINVYVDGVDLGNPQYGFYREDIATIFPDYNNSNNSGCSYLFDTTQYSNGVHMIQWTVTDNAGNTDGIGSRYFTIINGTSLDVENASMTLLSEGLTILPAYPNPFNPSTTIRYGLNNDSPVTIKIYNITGKLISTLLNEYQVQGWHSVVWNGTNQLGKQVPAGLYINKIISGSEVKTTKLMLLK